jgi:mannosyl-oligosaccharide alpha-1,2-mannosidase
LHPLNGEFITHIAKMMILFRRRLLSLTLVVVCLILFFLYSRPMSSQHIRGQIPISAKPPKIPSHIDWSAVKTRYPVKNIKKLPKPQPGASLPRLQAAFPQESPEARQERLSRLEAVKSNFTHAWTGYRMYAWLADEVTPISGQKVDAFGGWGATLVDALGKLLDAQDLQLTGHAQIHSGSWA